jgi:hypothetical protein
VDLAAALDEHDRVVADVAEQRLVVVEIGRRDAVL